MSEWTVFECDVTGERFGAKNDVMEFDVVRRRSNGWDTHSEVVHISFDEMDERGVHYPGKFKRVFVERGDEGDERIVAAEYRRGMWIDDVTKFEERDSVLFGDIEESFFQFVEEEVLY